MHPASTSKAPAIDGGEVARHRGHQGRQMPSASARKVVPRAGRSAAGHLCAVAPEKRHLAEGGLVKACWPPQQAGRRSPRTPVGGKWRLDQRSATWRIPGRPGIQPPSRFPSADGQRWSLARIVPCPLRLGVRCEAPLSERSQDAGEGAGRPGPISPAPDRPQDDRRARPPRRWQGAELGRALPSPADRGQVVFSQLSRHRQPSCRHPASACPAPCTAGVSSTGL